MKPFKAISYTLAGLLLACVGSAARAEIEQITATNGQYVPQMSLPKLPRVTGWTLSPSASLAERARVLLPAGKTLATTDAVISAMAYPKTALAANATLDDFIRAVQQNDRRMDPGRAIAPVAGLTDKAGRTLKAYTFTGGDGAAGETAYGTETSNGASYWTVFIISARTPVALADNIASFRNVIAAYQ